MIKKYLFNIFALLFFYQAFTQSNEVKIDCLITAYTRINKFNGSALIKMNNKIIFKKSYGLSDVTSKNKINDESVFRIGSLTKTFTSAIVLKLIENNQLSLQDKLNQFFPNYPNGDKITIEHLLTHTSGIYEILDNPEFYKNNLETKTNSYNLLSYFIEKPLSFEPGTKFMYSNSGYILLGLIIEKITGSTYGEILEKWIFKPFNMKNSGYDFVKLSNENKAIGYSHLSKLKSTKAVLWDSSYLYSSGSIFSTINDLNKWQLVLSKNKFLNKSTINNAYQPFTKEYGYGWFVDTFYDKKVISHGGNVDGFTSYFVQVPENKITIILLNNITNTKLETIGNTIISILLNKPYNTPRPAKAMLLDELTLQKLTGTYDVSSNYQVQVLREEKHLFYKVNDDAKIEIYARNENTFFMKDDDTEIIFVKDDDGNTTKIIIKQGLSKKIGDKIK